MSLMLALLLAQVGPSVSPGAGGALPQAPLEIPRKAKPGEPAPIYCVDYFYQAMNNYETFLHTLLHYR